MEAGSSAMRRQRRLQVLWLVAVLWTAFAAALAWWLIRLRVHDYRDRALETTLVRAGSARDTLNLTLKQLAALPANLARQPALHELLEAPRAPAGGARPTHPVLEAAQTDFDLQLVLLLDAGGSIVAAGRAEAPSPAALGNVSHRRYFQEAMQSGHSSQFLLGRVSGVPGMYFSHRVERDGRVLGVAVVKQAADVLNKLFGEPASTRVLVSDANGVVVLGNRPGDLLQRLPAEQRPTGTSAAPDWEAIYQQVPAALPWHSAIMNINGRAVQTAQIDGASHLAVASALDGWPFTVHVLVPLAGESAIVTTLAGAATAIWFGGCLLLWLGWRRLESLQDALQARRDMAELTDALPLTVFRYLLPRGSRVGRFLFVGRGMNALLGIDPQTLHDDPTKPWRLAGDPQGKPPLSPVEFRVQTGTQREARTLWLLAHSTPQGQPNGDTVFNGYWLDISRNRETKARFEAVFDHAPNGYMLFDRRRGITHCNPAALHLFGTDDMSALHGRIPWFPGLSPEQQADGRASRERALQLMRQHFESAQRVQVFDWRFCRIDGTEFDAEVSVIALTWDGEPQFCAILEDVTLRKQAEQAMLLARETAEAASQTKSSFLANMSHELRTPMNAIIGMTHLALEDGLPERQRDYIDKANSAAQDLLQILNDILDVSKIEAGHMEIEAVSFDLESVIDDMADVLALKADEKGIELLFSAAPDMPLQLVGDPLRLRQVLVNLGGNAIKFTEAGEVTVGMELQQHIDGEQVELHGWVRDTGSGLTPEQLVRIFQPFMQGDSSTTRRFGGTGLGLAICRQLVERMGGRLWAESEPGHGSTFHFTARFGLAEAPGRASAKALREELRGQRALVVDDNPTALDVLARLLEGLGITVDRAEGGARALALLAPDPAAYSWILLDWKMAGMDGVSCARRILQQHPQVRHCILLITAFGRERALHASGGLPLAGVLQKPITPSNLADSLMQARRVNPAPELARRQGAPAPLLPEAGRLARGADTAGAELARQRLAGARVLLVEDHPMNQELACELLKRAGMQVVLAGDGQEALRRLEDAGPFDGVLMDCQMPLMDGYTATRLLRADARWQRLPVIAMTASALVADRERALASGMNAHITKPLNVAVMLQTMAQWIVPSRPGAAPSTDVQSTEWSPLGAPAGAIDVADGLSRCLGEPALYQRVLTGFRQEQQHFDQNLHSARAEGRSADALRQVHDLKGLAGSIGAAQLQALALQLHSAMSEGDDSAIALAQARVGAELEQVLREIDTLLARRLENV
jgi:two-component system, sensor histidine kinase and response regulator